MRRVGDDAWTRRYSSGCKHLRRQALGARVLHPPAMRMTPSIVGFALLMGCAPSSENLENEDFEERGPRFITIGADAVGTAEDALAMRQPGARVTPLAANDK